MSWNETYPSFREPTMDEIADYIGGEAKEWWNSLMQYMLSAYKAKPKLFYSGCSGKPGWNIKFKKSGQSFGTLYPEKNAFSVFIVFSYRFDSLVKDISSELSYETAELYENAEDYMKMGKWIMFKIDDTNKLEDYKKLISVKLPPKIYQ